METLMEDTVASPPPPVVVAAAVVEVTRAAWLDAASDDAARQNRPGQRFERTRMPKQRRYLKLLSLEF
jgi:hypothetical protein